jgi:hypothetical protein
MTVRYHPTMLKIFAFLRRSRAALPACVLALSLYACGGSESPPQQSSPDSPPAATGAMPRTPAPPGATVFFISPGDSSTVSSPVTVKFGISGMAVAPAGNMAPATGHHHLLIDTELADANLPVPSDDNHLHFGKGQTETSLDLPAGSHTLQLVLGDGNHIPHDPPVTSGVITITVE